MADSGALSLNALTIYRKDVWLTVLMCESMCSYICLHIRMYRYYLAASRHHCGPLRCICDQVCCIRYEMPPILSELS